METRGKFVIPEELCVGNTFSGFKVEASIDKETCHVWIFSRNNHAVTIAVSYDDYFTILSNPAERERILDQMAAEMHQVFREKSELKFGY